MIWCACVCEDVFLFFSLCTAQFLSGNGAYNILIENRASVQLYIKHVYWKSTYTFSFCMFILSLAWIGLANLNGIQWIRVDVRANASNAGTLD